MEGLLSMLLFAGLFFVMMRFGCGAHMMHGPHDHGRKNKNQQKHTDPVCGMEVDIEQGYGKIHDGDLYRFYHETVWIYLRQTLEQYCTYKGIFVFKLEYTQFE